jgi:hypothetical protein
VSDSNKANVGPLVRAFFEAAWTLRVPPPAKTPIAGSGTGGIQLKPVDERNGWLGDVKTKEVSSSIAYLRPRREAAWLPDESSAKLWQAFASGQ